MMLVLFIEDEPNSAKPVALRLEEEIPGVETEIHDFHEAADAISKLRPDIVILDILRPGPGADPDTAGFATRDEIWEKRFCPIIVHSARPELYENAYPPHPLIESIQKGSESDSRVLETVNKFLPLTDAVRNTEAEVHRQLTEAMKAITPIAAATIGDEGTLAETVMRSGRRRVAALMDEPLPGEATLAGWEQYLHPPVSADVQLGDILQEKDAGCDAQSFRVALTPSCDMVRSSARSPKVQQVLVAKCCPMGEAFEILGLAKNSRIASIKSRLLSQGYAQAIIPFPPLPNVIPAMAANLRDLELIPIDDIGDNGAFCIVASIDSPFRELVSWAYLQIACRPGLPERDLDAWAKEIICTTTNADASNQ